ncbi:DUF2288 domain-containing protein [Tumidithrix helvetica PCC 7403]|uniref:DUF2288 domain-containing protein n=1 Tax=Tumidithrix helvetica TaxID=3457545 RepID=UPI003C85BE83
MSDLQKQLQEMVDTAKWDWLEVHALKGRVVIVSPQLDLVEAGVAVAEDNSKLVKQWLDDSWLYAPTEAHIDRWNQERDKEFTSLIIHPFVLIKELPAELPQVI